MAQQNMYHKWLANKQNGVWKMEIQINL